MSGVGLMDAEPVAARHMPHATCRMPHAIRTMPYSMVPTKPPMGFSEMILKIGLVCVCVHVCMCGSGGKSFYQRFAGEWLDVIGASDWLDAMRAT